MTRHRLRAALGALLALALLGGCGLDLNDVQLPGGTARGSHVYRVTAEFGDVLDLVPQSAVKVDDVTVGSVERIRLDGFVARVRLRIKSSVKLPDNAEASIAQTSLLGEKFVALYPPSGERPVGSLSNGDVIPLSRTSRSTEVEEVLTALSMLLNGGGLQQLQSINQELSKALTGREPDVRDLLNQLNTLIGGLDEQKAQIVRALNGLDRLTATLAAQRATIATALDQLGPGLKVLADERRQLTQTLAMLAELGSVGTRVILASRDDLVANLRALQPVLANLAAAGRNLPGALELLLTYPFPRNFPAAVTGDFTRLSATLDVSLSTLTNNIGLVRQLPGQRAGSTPLPLAGQSPRRPTGPQAPRQPQQPLLPQLPALPLPNVDLGNTTGDLLGLLLGGLGG